MNTQLVILILLFAVTSTVGVVTGSNSLITVPVMFQFGVDPKVAVATNMFGLTFMSIGASIPFFRTRAFDFKKVAPLCGLTFIGSAFGAILVGLITTRAIPLIVAVSMICVTIFTILRRNSKPEPSSASALTGMVLAFLLAIYGGLYSGGYVTMLTAVLVGFLGYGFAESVASTKVVNVVSSAIASLIFMWQGLVDYRLGFILAVTMFVSAYVGAHVVTKLSEVWLRRIFITTVAILAVKTIYDFYSVI